MPAEAEITALLRRLAPNCDKHWIGATPEQVEALERHAGRPLPAFYKWFLEQMGHSMGPIASPRRDMRASSILAAYESGFTPPSPSTFLIGIEFDDFMPMLVFYDLGRPTRDDAWVCSYPQQGGFRQDEFETLREDLAWGAFSRFRGQGCTHKIGGTFTDSERDILGKLGPTLERLGFMKMLTAGPHCGLFDRADAGLSCAVPAGRESERHMFFELVGDDEAALRSVLATIAVETSLEIEIQEWK